MKKCTNCNSPFTEFDVRFEKNLKNNSSNSTSSECFHCRTQTGGIYDALKNRDKAIKGLKEDISCALDYIAVLVITIWSFVLSSRSENIIWPCMFVAFVCISILFQIRGTYVATKKMKLETDFSYFEKRLVSTVSNDGTIVTKSQDFLVGGTDDGSDAKTWLFFTYFFWCILRPIIIYLKSVSHLKKTCPKEIIAIYDKTKKEVQEIQIPEKIIKKQKEKIDEYNNKIEGTIQKYEITGENNVKKELSKIKKPTLDLFQKKYVITEYLSLKKGSLNLNCYLMLYRNKAGAIVGKAVLDGYFVNLSEKNWRDVWIELYSLSSSRADKKSYSDYLNSEYLNYVLDQYKTYLQ